MFEDDGAGFSDDFRVRAFETGKVDGVGLGLFVVERLASLSGGGLELGRSSALGGARVVFRLPGAAFSSGPSRA
ncbi:MAG: ATP-binding protein [Labilithrix sp.]|nr:ATP-binding protein [Labilithrix sp.]